MRAVLTALAVSFAAVTAQAGDLSAQLARVTPADHVLGRADAPVTLIEYGSVACPACAAFNESVFPQIKANYIDTGKVRYVFRPMLTGVATIAVAGTRLAECAGKDKYFAVVDAMMRGQKDYYAWGESNIIAKPILNRIAAGFGFSEAAFNACASDPSGLQKLNSEHEAALDAGIRSTPSLFVNGKAVENHDLASLEAAIKVAK
jgi:protein-disulfide isomerase